jgi:hypothetical protein
MHEMLTFVAHRSSVTLYEPSKGRRCLIYCGWNETQTRYVEHGMLPSSPPTALPSIVAGMRYGQYKETAGNVTVASVYLPSPLWNHCSGNKLQCDCRENKGLE